MRSCARSCYRYLDISWFVCLSVGHIVSLAKMAELIDMQFVVLDYSQSGV